MLINTGNLGLGSNRSTQQTKGHDNNCDMHFLKNYIPDLKQIREDTGLSIEGFACSIQVPIDIYKKWEDGEEKPEGAAKALLKVIDKSPEVINHLKKSS